MSPRLLWIAGIMATGTILGAVSVGVLFGVGWALFYHAPVPETWRFWVTVFGSVSVAAPVAIFGTMLVEAARLRWWWPAQ